MKERAVLIRADYGKVELHLKEVMDERGISRNQLAKRIDARFEVVDKWYKGEVEKMDLDILARICYALNCTTEDLICYVSGDEAEI
ncbi:MAG: helix-turn-helix transcriptional regulator [Bacillota bacterium]|nr:helix-turn-helix transcriptional regulator [Bacillota bacterium]